VANDELWYNDQSPQALQPPETSAPAEGGRYASVHFALVCRGVICIGAHLHDFPIRIERAARVRHAPGRAVAQTMMSAVRKIASLQQEMPRQFVKGVDTSGFVRRRNDHLCIRQAECAKPQRVKYNQSRVLTIQFEATSLVA